MSTISPTVHGLKYIVPRQTSLLQLNYVLLITVEQYYYQLQLNSNLTGVFGSMLSLYDDTVLQISKMLIPLFIFSEHFSKQRLNLLFLYLDFSLL